MLTLITSQELLQNFMYSMDWHDAVLREIHFAPAHPDSGISLIRICVELRSEKCTLEIVAFDAEWCSFNPHCDFDGEKAGTVGRRVTEVDLGAVSLRCGCLAYHRISGPEEGNSRLSYGINAPFDDLGLLVPPYDIDWRAALDDASTSR